jgi:SAM-dependent methyltransferase
MSDLHDRIRSWWDDDADHYDRSAGHSLTDAVQAAAWRAALHRLLPPAPAAVLDVGAGTGAMSLLAAGMGHHVTALDLSEAMLEAARTKARRDGATITFVHGPAEDPPAGPFDVVMERHVAWTLPDPPTAFAAWRGSASDRGRLVLLEGSWGGEGPWTRLKDAAASSLERAWEIPDHHHAPYPADVLERLPLADTRSPVPLVEAVSSAGWREVRVYRLRDVEWAIERAERWPLGWLTHRDRYAVVADA